MRLLWLFLTLLIHFKGWNQNGPYPPLALPDTPVWEALDSLKALQQIPAATLWQSDRIDGHQGIILSSKGLALLPSGALDSNLLRAGTWLESNAQMIGFSKHNRFATISKIEDISQLVLSGIPDSISPAARSIKIANRLLENDLTPAYLKQSRVSSFYGGNRYFHWYWQYFQAELLGQIETPQGHSFVLVKLLPEISQEKAFPHLSLPSGESPNDSLLFVFGKQKAPSHYLSPGTLENYYTHLSPLIREVNLAMQNEWEKESLLPEWLQRMEAAAELKAPLHPFAEVGTSIQESRQRDKALLDTLRSNTTEWQRYYRLQEAIQEAEVKYFPYLEAKLLAEELIPSNLQLFRLVRFLAQFEKQIAQNPSMLEKRKQSILVFLNYFYDQFDPEIDQAAAASLFAFYFDRLKVDLLSPYAVDQYLFANKDYTNLATIVYQKSKLIHPKKQLELAEKDLGAFLENLQKDYAFQFFKHWSEETQSLIVSPLKQQERKLQELYRRWTAGMLYYLPEAQPIEAGFFSYTHLPIPAGSSMEKTSAHYLGNYPAMSPVINAQGHLKGFTIYEGDNKLLEDQVSNQVLSIDFLWQLKEQYPGHPVVLELFGEE